MRKVGCHVFMLILSSVLSYVLINEVKVFAVAS